MTPLGCMGECVALASCVCWRGAAHGHCVCFSAICLLFGLLLANGGILKHLRAPYGRMEEYHSHAWKLGVLINVFGVGNYATGFYYVADGGELGEPGFYATLIVVVALVAVVILKRKLGKKPTDAAWYDATAGVDATRTCKRHAELTSQYVTMSDGCRIAVDVHLPLWWGKPGVNSPPLPTVLHLTRYGRNFAVKRSCRWLLGRYFNMRSLRYASPRPAPVALPAAAVRSRAANGVWVAADTWPSSSRVATRGYPWMCAARGRRLEPKCATCYLARRRITRRC